MHMANLIATASIDVDTLHSIFKSKNLSEGYSYSWNEYEEGLANLCDFFDSLGIKATLFCVGADLTHPANREFVKDAYNRGHEIANHTMNHVQGLRLLTKDRKENEIAQCEEICALITGEKPVGFRAPGWNIDEEVLEILIRRGYQYDSSIFPTFLMPIMKAMYLNTMKNGAREDRTTMGCMRYMFAPIRPYRTSATSFREGKDGLWEFPIAVSPIIRFPLFATILLKLGLGNFRRTYQKIKKKNNPLQFMLHLFDFVDFSKKQYQRDVDNLRNVYVPQSLTMPYEDKMRLIKKAFDMMLNDYDFKTYCERCAV